MGLSIGVRDKNVEYMMNDAATVIAFVARREICGPIHRAMKR